MAHIEITYDGELALTTAQAAERYGVSQATMRKTVARLGVQPFPEPLDARTPLYSAAALDAAMKARPGKGAHLRRREPVPGQPGA